MVKLNTVFKRIIYNLNVLYLVFVPSLALYIQGGVDYIAIYNSEILGFLFGVFSKIFGIVLISIMFASVGYNQSLIKTLRMFLIGPIAGFVVVFYTNEQPFILIYNLYIIEAISFMFIFILLLLKAKNTVPENYQNIFLYVGTPILLMIFVFGFMGSINIEFFLQLFDTNHKKIALAIMVSISAFGMYKMCVLPDFDSDDTSSNEDLKQNGVDFIAMSVTVIGIVVYLAQELYVK